MRCHRLLHTCTGKTQTKHWDASVDYSCRLNPYFEGWTSDNGVQRACPGATFLIFMPSQLYFNTNFSIGCPIPIQMPKIVALSPPPLPQLCTSLQHISKALRKIHTFLVCSYQTQTIPKCTVTWSVFTEMRKSCYTSGQYRLFNRTIFVSYALNS